MTTDKGLFLVFLTVILLSTFKGCTLPADMFSSAVLALVSAAVGACAVAFYARRRVL